MDGYGGTGRGACPGGEPKLPNACPSPSEGRPQARPCIRQVAVPVSGLVMVTNSWLHRCTPPVIHPGSVLDRLAGQDGLLPVNQQVSVSWPKRAIWRPRPSHKPPQKRCFARVKKARSIRPRNTPQTAPKLRRVGAISPQTAETPTLGHTSGYVAQSPTRRAPSPPATDHPLWFPPLRGTLTNA